MDAYVWADGACLAFADVDAAVAGALDIASSALHPRVGVDIDPDGARQAAARALPGMVVCPRREEFHDVRCYPLTDRVAMVCRRPDLTRIASGIRQYAVPRARS
jgi:hypothetical protein